MKRYARIYAVMKKELLQLRRVARDVVPAAEVELEQLAPPALSERRPELVPLAAGGAERRRGGVDPASKSGELALLLIRVYRSLYALVGGREEDLKHWMQTANRHTGGVPAEQVKSVAGLVNVVEYLDAIVGRV